MDEKPAPDPESAQVIISRIFRPLSRVVRLDSDRPRRPFTIGVGTVVAGFACLIAIGTLLLSLPAARVPGVEWDLLTALFTSASATCVTGLAVVDTGVYWSTFGQGVILGLIQLGGFGIMTAAMFILIIFGRPVSLKDRFAIRETTGLPRLRRVSTLIVTTIGLTVTLELVGTAILYFATRHALPDTGDGLWKTAFLSVSAFNNAGFDNLGGLGSLARFATTPTVLLTIGALVILGGLGPIVLLDLAGRRSFRYLSLQSKLVLLTTLGLLIVGFIGVFAAEFANHSTIGLMTLADKLTNSVFYSITPRTAGFSTFPIQEARDQTQILTMVLMYIGGATGGTAGGIKVGTFAVLVLATLASVRGHETVRAAGREIGHPIVYRALGVAALYMVLIMLGTLLLSITDNYPFHQVLFEAVSALGTVGLTTGMTPELSPLGRVIIIGLMFVGRIGPLVVVYVLARSAREPRYRLPEGRVGIG